MSTFPGSPRILKGAIVAYTLPALVPRVVVFQYNPEQVTRSLSPRTAEAGAGGGRGEANRTDGPPDETITLAVEIDAADQLERPDEHGTTVEVGLHPVLAALEGLMYPPFPVVVANQVLSAFGGAFILGEPVPLALLVWGAARVLPVRVQSLSITEQAFDTRLNPINAKADLGLTGAHLPRPRDDRSGLLGLHRWPPSRRRRSWRRSTSARAPVPSAVPLPF
ncbi:MAG: hypothetical protein R3D25_04700 [Geminicoccaceae bacterium]